MEPTTSAPITPNAAQNAANDAPPSLLDESFFTWMGRQITHLSDQITKQSFDALHFLTTFAAAPPTPINTQAAPWSPITLAPTDNSSQIFSHLDPTTLRSFARVSKTWQKETTLAASLQEKKLYQEFRDKGVIFAPEDWRTYFGDPGEVPSLDPKTFKILKGPCPFWPEKRVEETHVLLFLPATNNGVPITFNSLGTLASAPQGGGGTATGYAYVWPQIITDHGNVPAGPARWLLITKQIVPGSRGMPFDEQVALLNAHPGYRVAKLGEAVALAFARCVSGGERLLRDTYTRCEEKGEDYRVVVGGFAPRGLRAYSRNFFYDLDGVVGVLPCESSPAIGSWSFGSWIRSLLPC